MQFSKDISIICRVLTSSQGNEDKLRALLPLLNRLLSGYELDWRPERGEAGEKALGHLRIERNGHSDEAVARIYRSLAGLLGVLFEKQTHEVAFAMARQLQEAAPEWNPAAISEPERAEAGNAKNVASSDGVQALEALESLLAEVGAWRYQIDEATWYFSEKACSILGLAIVTDAVNASNDPSPAAFPAPGEVFSISHQTLLAHLSPGRCREAFESLAQGMAQSQALWAEEIDWRAGSSTPSSPINIVGRAEEAWGDRRLLWVGIPQGTASGKPEMLLGSVHDVTRRESFTRRMQFHVALEEVITRISGQFITLPGDEIAENIGQALEEIGRFIDVDRVYLIDYNKVAEGVFSLQDEWQRPELSPLRDVLGTADRREAPWAYAQFSKGVPIHALHWEALPAEAEWERAYCKTAGTLSFLWLPIHIEKTLRGFVAFETVGRQCRWPQDVIGLLRTFSESLFNALERKHAVAIQNAHLAYLEHLEKVNQVLLSTVELDAMLPRLMEVIGDIFHCDRAWLQYPCTPGATYFEVRAEYTTPEYPGALSQGGILPASTSEKKLMRLALASEYPVAFDPRSRKLPERSQQTWEVQSSLVFALKPRIGAPWLFGMHQCDHLRVWTRTEIRLFRDVGLRLTDALNMVLLHQDLQQSEARFRSVLEANPDLIFVFDRAGRCHDVMPRHHPLLMEPLEEILNKNIYERLPKDIADTTLHYIKKVLDEGGVYTFEFNVPHAKVDTWVSVRATKFEGGSNPKALLSCRDVTELKHAEMERQNLEAQMQQAQKLESLGVLAGGIAHDFNNLLMGILGNADMALSEMSRSSPVQDYLNDIICSSQRAADLCRQMLAYSGKGHFLIQAINLSEIVEEMAHLLEISISKKAILRYDFAQSLPRVKADATQIRQVVMNLITNASDAIGDRSGVITIATGAMECDRQYLHGTFLDDKLSEGIYAYIEVSDTGCGMDANTRERLFEPFYSTKFTGRGLGMSAVLGIVRGHEGAIKCYSEVGRGTTFKVLLPIFEEEEEEISAGDRKGKAIATPKTGTVLVVDDEETIRAISRKVLEKAGYSVLTAADGREAVETFETYTERIDLVLLDMTMPHLSGPEVYARLRAQQSDLPVILSSGYSELEVADQFEELAGFIQKPYLGSELLEIVGNVLAGRSA